MSRLRFPLRTQLTDRDQDDAALVRIWDRVEARSPRQQQRRGQPSRWLVALGAMSVAAACGVALLVLQSRHDAGPLVLADGRPVATMDAAAGAAVVALADGSRVELGAGARLKPLESTGSTFAAVLEEGRATFDVRPGGPRRWRIECGLATVEVLGTRFSCERFRDRLHVAVERGAVLVSGERVPDRARRLSAGESLNVAAAAAAAGAAGAAAGLAPAPSAPADAQPSGMSPAESPTAEGRDREGVDPDPEPAPAWRELARRGRHGEAFATLGAQGVGREARRLGIADLFALADVARLSGHPASAEAPLQRILTDFARDPQASIAAFALGRLELDALGRPARAAAAFERALDLGIPRTLREDVRARLVEAYLQQGDRAAAGAAAAAYAREFPAGRHAAEIGARLSRR